MKGSQNIRYFSKMEYVSPKSTDDSTLRAADYSTRSKIVFICFIENFKKRFQCTLNLPKYVLIYIFFIIFFQNGDSPLHIAAAMGRRKLVRILLESPLIDMELKNQQNEGKEKILIYQNAAFVQVVIFQKFSFISTLKSTQYKKLVPNALPFTY